MLIDSLIKLTKRIKWYFIKRNNMKIRQAILEIKAKTAIKHSQKRLKIINEVDEGLEESHRSGARSPSPR